MTTSLSPIGAQIENFLRAALAEAKPNWIVTVERKGTALLRTLVESPRGPGADWVGWQRVLSSEALDHVPDSYLRDARILLLDDGIYHGHKMGEALEKLRERNVPQDNVRVASFSVHEKSPFHPVHFKWFGELTTSTYRDIRSSMIRFFQERGSLLLDTEHIEVPVELNCGRLEFFDALCHGGIGVEHVSAAGRANLTIYNPPFLREDQFRKRLPPFATVKDVVQKFRVVERDANRYAIIPICFPSILADTSAAHVQNLEACLSKVASENVKANFHLVGLSAAIELFRTAFACLRELINAGRVRVSVPRPDVLEGSISHVSALFPSLDVEALHAVVERAVEEGRNWKPKRGELARCRRIEATPGTEHADTLSQLQRLSLNRVLRLSEKLPGAASGASLSDLLSIARRGGIQTKLDIHEQEALLSAAHDNSIDTGEMVTDTAERPFADGRRRLVRVFKIDGELVSSDVRRAGALWRSSSPPPVW